MTGKVEKVDPKVKERKHIDYSSERGSDSSAKRTRDDAFKLTEADIQRSLLKLKEKESDLIRKNKMLKDKLKRLEKERSSSVYKSSQKVPIYNAQKMQ